MEEKETKKFMSPRFIFLKEIGDRHLIKVKEK